MKILNSRKLVGIIFLALFVTLSVSSEAMGQGRGRRVSHLDKKCSKFVNCHDARDGRVDGRGRNRRVGFGDRIFRRSRRDRDIVRTRRNRDRDRDFNHDRNRRRR